MRASKERIKEIIDKNEKSIKENRINFNSADMEALRRMTPDQRTSFLDKLGKANISGNKAEKVYNSFFGGVTKPDYGVDHYGNNTPFQGEILKLCNNIANESDAINFFRGFRNAVNILRGNFPKIKGDFHDVRVKKTRVEVFLLKKSGNTNSSIYGTKNDEFNFHFDEANGECKLDKVEIILSHILPSISVTEMDALVDLIEDEYLCHSVMSRHPYLSYSGIIEIYF